MIYRNPFRTPPKATNEPRSGFDAVSRCEVVVELFDIYHDDGTVDRAVALPVVPAEGTHYARHLYTRVRRPQGKARVAIYGGRCLVPRHPLARSWWTEASRTDLESINRPTSGLRSGDRTDKETIL